MFTRCGLSSSILAGRLPVGGLRRLSCVWAAAAVPLRLSSTQATAGKGNYFAFFGLPKQPTLHGSELQRRYHELQRKVHPDRENVNAKLQEEHASGESGASAEGAACGGAAADHPSACLQGSTTGEGRHSDMDISTYANAAYETLKDPFLRCRYLARLAKAQEVKSRAAKEGGEGEGGSSSGGPSSSSSPPSPPLELTPLEEEELVVEDDRRAMQTRITSPNRPLSEAFLMEMLLMNELIFGGDRSDPNTLARMKVLQADLKERNAQYFDDVNAAWQAKDMDSFFGLIEEWTYIHNALTHLINRL